MATLKGFWGIFSTKDIIHYLNPEKSPLCMETGCLSYKAWKLVQYFDLDTCPRIKDSQKYDKCVIFHLLGEKPRWTSSPKFVWVLVSLTQSHVTSFKVNISWIMNDFTGVKFFIFLLIFAWASQRAVLLWLLVLISRFSAINLRQQSVFSTTRVLEGWGALIIVCTLSCLGMKYCISSNRSRVSNTNRVSNTSLGSDGICLNTSRVSTTTRVSNRSWGLMANTIELMALVHRTVVCCIIRDILWYFYGTVYTWLWHPEVQKCKKLHFKLKLEAGEPDGSNRSQVSNTSRISNKSRGSDSIVLMQAGGFYWRKYGRCKLVCLSHCLSSCSLLHCVAQCTEWWV